MTRVTTLITKAVGVLFSVAGGMWVHHSIASCQFILANNLYSIASCQFILANNVLLGGGVGVRVWIGGQRKITPKFYLSVVERDKN